LRALDADTGALAAEVQEATLAQRALESELAALRLTVAADAAAREAERSELRQEVEDAALGRPNPKQVCVRVCGCMCV
jgi:hypothetical protein